MTKICETINYDRFEQYFVNRRVRRIDALTESMRRYGFIDAFPIYAVQNGGSKIKIKDGHHRFEAAKRLNIPVKYVLLKDNDQSIQELNETVNKWSTRDFMESYANQGYQDYFFLMKFTERTSINIPAAVSILLGRVGGGDSGSAYGNFREGKFAISECGLRASMFIEECVALLKNDGCKFAANTHLIAALNRLFYVKKFNRNQFKSKLSRFGSLLKKQHTIDDYIANLSLIYNRNSGKKVMLQLLVDEMMQNRRAKR